MKVPLADPAAQQRALGSELEAAVLQVLRSGRYILGAPVEELEREIAAYLGVNEAVGVASGTDALELALRAFGIGPGDQVIVPAFSFFATVESVLQIGAEPVFADISLDDYCIDAEDAARRITPRTKAVVPVHLYGHPADMSAIGRLADEFGLTVIEDNAQAMGATYRGGKAGSLGHAGCLSFFPTKNLGGIGDGGMVALDDAQAASRLRMLRTHGWERKNDPRLVGRNSRLDALQAAALRVKLPRLDEWNRMRRRRSDYYRERLSGMSISLPQESEGAHHVYHLYVIRSADRDGLQLRLRERGIACGVYYPRPLHLLEPCRHLGWNEGDLPRAEQASREVLAIPLFPEMSRLQQDEVVAGLAAAS